jgi:hypothetical protein
MLLHEKRISPRRNASIEAVIGFGRTRMACIVRNVSDGGAKLEVTSVRGVPDTFDLHVPNHRPQRCRVAWRSLKELGVAFAVPGAIHV